MSELSTYQCERDSIVKEMRSTPSPQRRQWLENRLQTVDTAIRNIQYNNPPRTQATCPKCGGRIG